MDFIFIDVNDPAYFDYVCAYQILYKPTMITTFVALNVYPWSFMCCANSQLDVLINKLENMKELIKITKAERSCDESDAYAIIFKGCVLHHSAILRFTKSMQATFSGQMSLNLFVSACIIGTTAVQIISIESPRHNITEVVWVLVYLSIIIGNLFVECYFGNSITHKSLKIPTIVFAGPWVDLPIKMKRNLVIFIAKAQQPIVLTAAKLVPVSMQTFTTVMNWTYKGFAVMNQMKK
ncbi:odorant receptor 49a-like [Ostrinia nubilalis]|uniref:odorant receptor 49a-like n=1 Tax=Ostrinia nubilalis TaxID=29057 RepID=UPI003082420A